MKKQTYALVTGAYWAFTLTDGALRVLVLLHFHDLGYAAVSLAFLFLLYEVFGVLTNLFGGLLGARYGLNRTLLAGLSIQVVALLMLAVSDPGWVEWLSVLYVMASQALSGIAKDLTKMSSKSTVKLAVAATGSAEGTDQPSDQPSGRLFTWVAALTGSKNALKGVGFFLGAALLSWIGFRETLLVMAGLIALVLVASIVGLTEEVGRASTKPKMTSLLAKSRAITQLSLARMFLFGARDIWFVVALPVYLDEELGWSYQGIGAFLAAWVIGYGIVQSAAPRLLRSRSAAANGTASPASLALALGLVATVIALMVTLDAATRVAIVGGLIVFGVVFALNSSLHSFLILAYSQSDDEVAMDVGFYYSANAAGRLLGTLLSGTLYLAGGLELALWGSAACLAITWVLSLRLPAVGRTLSPAPSLG